MNQIIKKNILIFAHYYYPDTASTGQLLQDQAEGMLQSFDVTVICTVPSYGGIISDNYKIQKYYQENINGVNVIRVRVPEFNKNNKLSRINNIASYFLRAIYVAKNTKDMDYIFTISQPPILGGLLGVIGKKIKKAKLIYCIQDFNPEQTMAVGYFKNKLFMKLMMSIDKYSCKKSDLIITVGRDLCKTLENRFKNSSKPKYIMINNWIDEEKIYPLPLEHNKVQAFRRKYKLENKFVFMYSGNIGLHYDLENLIKVIGKFKDYKTIDGKEVCFSFVGAGAILDKLQIYVSKHQIKNVIFIPYQDKKDLIYSLNAADVHWCMNAKGIKGISCPSKFYGIAACAKPIIGVLESESEIRSLIEISNCGLVSEPGNYDEVEKNINLFINMSSTKELINMGTNGYQYLISNFTKEKSIQKYIDAILNC